MKISIWLYGIADPLVRNITDLKTLEDLVLTIGPPRIERMMMDEFKLNEAVLMLQGVEKFLLDHTKEI